MRTALYERHCQLGAKMVSFAGWEMPIQYKGILAEHQAVRDRVGLFDVSHMGRIHIEGPQAEPFLESLATNKIGGKTAHSVVYTVFCQEDGGCVDDLMIYRIDDTHFFVIANASNRDNDLAHLQKHAAGWDVAIYPEYEDGAILALQGPLAMDVLCRHFPQARDIKPMNFATVPFLGDELILSRTGYTGAGGFELIGNGKQIVALWDQFINDDGVEPIGLGARDTLRLEMGFALYGHEITPDIAPTESVAAWAVKLSKEDFLGKKALDTLEISHKKRHESGVLVLGEGIARQGSQVYFQDQPVGVVTSGTFSPTLRQPIAIILTHVPLALDDEVEIQIRQHRSRAKIVKIPFVKKM